MGDHVKPKSMCSSYNIDFMSTVIKHAEGNNNQAMAWVFCVVEQNVQCWEGERTPNKGRKLNPKRITT